MNENHSLLFVTVTDLSDTSGGGVATKEMVAALAKNSPAEFTLVCPRPRGGMPQKVERYVDDTIYMAPQGDGGVVRHLRLSLHTFSPTRKAIERTNPDAVIARMHPTMLAPALLSRWYSIPYFLLARGISYKTLRFASLLSRVHSFNVRTAEMVYAASEEIKKDSDDMRGSQQRPSKVVSNGVDVDKFEPIPTEDAREALDVRISDDDFVVGFVGTMYPYHAVQEFIESLTLVDDATDTKLLIVGDGDQMGTCRALVRDLDLEDRVVFTGYVAHDEVPVYISACDAAYSVVKKQSATPLKCFEYLACQTPVIVNQVEGMDFVSDTESGLIIDEVSPEDISEAIDQFYRMEPEERREMGERGRDYVSINRTWDSLALEVLDDVDSTIVSD